MNKKCKIKKGDLVVVVTGKDKGKQGKVLRVFPQENRLIVEGVNIVKRHTKVNMTNGGGILTKEASLHISNVAYVDPKEGARTKIGIKLLSDGQKVRYAKRSGETIK